MIEVSKREKIQKNKQQQKQQKQKYFCCIIK